MPGADFGFVVLLAYTVFCWLFAPAILVALGMHGERKKAAAVAGLLLAIWVCRGALEGSDNHDPNTLTFYATALALWALTIAQFTIPAYSLVFLIGVAERRAWLLGNKFTGMLLLANAVAVWALASKCILVPSGTEAWLKAGSALVGLAGATLVGRTISATAGRK